MVSLDLTSCKLATGSTINVTSMQTKMGILLLQETVQLQLQTGT